MFMRVLTKSGALTESSEWDSSAPACFFFFAESSWPSDTKKSCTALLLASSKSVFSAPSVVSRTKTNSCEIMVKSTLLALRLVVTVAPPHVAQRRIVFSRAVVMRLFAITERRVDFPAPVWTSTLIW